MSSNPSRDQSGLRVGAKIRAMRLAKKLTQSQLAKPDFPISYISAIERGQIQPSLRALEILAARLGLSSTQLLAGNTPDNPNNTMPNAILSDDAKEQLQDRGIIGLQGPGEETIESSAMLRIRVDEDPLTAQNMTTILAALTELHTKCWLISQERFTDVIEYTQTRNVRFAEEAHLVIAKLTHNSPLDVNIGPNLDKILLALKDGIDGVVQADLRRKATALDNKAKELEMKLKEQVAQSTLADQKQARTLEAEKAELEKQAAQLKIEQQQLGLERQRVAIQKEILELEQQRTIFAFETAVKMVERLAPDADATTKAMLAQTLLPQLLQLGNGKGLEPALLLAPKSGEQDVTPEQE